MIRKAAALAVVALVLGAQASMLPLSSRYFNWYWPFVSYPMYSSASTVNHTVFFAEAYAYRCGTAADSILVTGDLVQRTLGTFRSDVRRLGRFMAERPSDDAERSRLEADLRGLVGRFHPEYCRLRLWSSQYTIGPSGLELPGVRTLAAEWPIERRPDQREREPGR